MVGNPPTSSEMLLLTWLTSDGIMENNNSNYYFKTTVVPLDKAVTEMTTKMTHLASNFYAGLISVAVSDG